jgi:hypothetical protein
MSTIYGKRPRNHEMIKTANRSCAGRLWDIQNLHCLYGATIFIAHEWIFHGIWIDVSDVVEEWRSALCLIVAMNGYVPFLEHVKQWNKQGWETVP